jgi:hypothetical protein
VLEPECDFGLDAEQWNLSRGDCSAAQDDARAHERAAYDPAVE